MQLSPNLAFSFGKYEVLDDSLWNKHPTLNIASEKSHSS